MEAAGWTQTGCLLSWGGSHDRGAGVEEISDARSINTKAIRDFMSSGWDVVESMRFYLAALGGYIESTFAVRLNREHSSHGRKTKGGKQIVIRYLKIMSSLSPKS